MVRVLSDSTSDLSLELIKRYNIGIIPLHVSLGGDEYIDGVNIDSDMIFKWSDEHRTTPKTSAPSLEDVTAIYTENLKKYDQLVVFTISASMSSSFQVCRMAAQALSAESRITVIDSENLSTGVGHLVIESAIMAEQGKNMKEIEEYCLKARKYVRSSFTVDTLTFLHRGGRCSGLAALLGSALKLHPRIVVENGAMHSDKKYRGSLNKVIMKYVMDLEADLKKAKPDRVFITHSWCDTQIVENVRQYLEGLGVFKEVLETTTAGVVSSHCGPGTLGVLFMENFI